MYKLTNVHRSAVGLPGNRMLKPGESINIEMTDEERKIMEDCGYVEICNLGGPPRRKDASRVPATKAETAGKRNHENGNSHVRTGTPISGKQ